jgi:YD repeat-containing protein
VCKYDNESLLTEGVDARGVKTNFVYDGLNRVLAVNYLGESGYATPNVNYTYDEIHANSFNKRRLTKVQTAANAAQGTPETKQMYDYDEVGQVKNHTQTIGNQSYNLTNGYNLAIDFGEISEWKSFQLFS